MNGFCRQYKDPMSGETDMKRKNTFVDFSIPYSINIDKEVENSEELSLLMGLNLLKTKILHINNL